jgi:hypothetical protein
MARQEPGRHGGVNPPLWVHGYMPLRVASSCHRQCRRGRHLLWRGLGEDFEKQRTDPEIPLALGTTAQTVIGSMADQVFELFSHDVVFIRWF